MGEPLAAGRFEAFSGQHFLMLGVFVAGAVAVVLLGRAHRGTDAARRFSRVFAVAIVCVTVPMQALQLTPGDWSFRTSLPLQLCDFAWVVAAWALWTHHPVPSALIYYWGLTLSIQGILTPALAESFPHPRFFGFWAMHLLIVWAALYLTLGLGVGPSWRTYRVAVLVTAVWAVGVYAFDVAFDVNYGYLVHKPGSASLLDLFGPWPVYILVALGLLLSVWALMTWPWVAADRRQTAASVA